MMDPDALERLAEFDAICFGAVGSRAVPDHVTLWGLRLAIVQAFDQAITLSSAGAVCAAQQRIAVRCCRRTTSVRGWQMEAGRRCATSSSR